MHIYIDESGSFTPGPISRPSISAVGALVIPSGKHETFIRRYKKLRNKLPKHKGEVKGSRLNELQVSRISDLLFDVGAIFEVCVIDFASLTVSAVDYHKEMQSNGLVKNLGDGHHPNLVESVYRMKEQLDRMSNQQYVQAVLMVRLIGSTLQHAHMYFSLRKARELSSYKWIIDGKSDTAGPDKWELWWKNFVCPSLQSDSIKNPLMRIREGRFHTEKRFTAKLTEYSKSSLGITDEETAFDISAIVRDNLVFSHKPLPGLEAVDIMTNAIRRSLVGNLKRPGWINIRRLMIHANPHYIRLVTLGSGENVSRSAKYINVIDDFKRGGRVMIPDHIQSKD